ncbi:hypothetical protein BIW11_11334 [Tropilaelaps mercedesae]|uniref:Exonuclease domain-containing protein n=1 Tax=Tropilaelaps mercedesae TaxID=418985 RepID=A0A1V9XC14_9ACAR|nr:hypothetical protein BIW11_11334 [Tropilaelaps mercedesae]
MDLRTLVFLDLECTHLPSRMPPFGPPRVTEVALLACRLRQFKRPFRVTDRISFCIRPPENVCSETSQVSGLDNFNLEQQPIFGGTASTLKSFMLTLDQPICLIAHNGNKLDFPLLKAELEASGDAWDDLDIHTCDSLEAFRFILPQHSEDHFSVAASECHLEEVFAAQTQSTSRPATDTVQSQTQPDCMCTPPKNPRFDVELSLPSDIEQPGMRTPPRSQQPPRPNHPPPPPHKKRVQSRFLEKGADGKMQLKRTSYKLIDIYRRMYLKPATQSHHALNDCEMLFKCCLIVRRELMQFLESRRTRFADVVPMWTRKSRPEITTRSGRVLATPTKKPPPSLQPGTPVRTGRRMVARRLLDADPNEIPDDEAFRPLDEITPMKLQL